MTEEAQSYDFVQQTPPAVAAVDPRVKAQIDAERRAMLDKVRPQPSNGAISRRVNGGGGFAFVQATPPAKRGFGEIQQR